MAWYERYIQIVPGVQGGAPVIRDTRTPIRSIVRYAQIYNQDIDALAQFFPHLEVEQIQAALAYYADSPWLVDADIQRHEEAFDRLSAAQWPA